MTATPRKTARFPASLAYRWLACTGSVQLCEGLPKQPRNKYAQAGYDAHHVLEVALDASLVHYLTHNRKYGNGTAAEAWTNSDFWMLPEDKEITASVQDCLDYVYGILDAHPDAQLVSEKFALLPTQEGEHVVGRRDVSIYIPSERLLVIIDFKHGAGVSVDAEEDPQLLTYAASIAFDYEWLAGHPVDNYRLVIVQPRAFHAQGPIREWDTTFDRLLDFYVQAEKAVAEALGPSPVLAPENERCRWCPGATICPALERQALSTFGQGFDSVKDLNTSTLPDVKTIPVDRLAYLLGASKTVERWFKEAYDQAVSLARQGIDVPGHKLVYTQARREWYGDDQYIAEQLAALSGRPADEFMPRKLVSITQADDWVVTAFKDKAGKGKKKQAAEDARQAMAFLTLKDTSGNVTMVPLSDPRPAVNIAEAHFQNVVVIPAGA